MSGDAHVRFCERLGVRFPWATRPLQEAFGAGTAAIIAPVGKLNYRNQTLIVNNNQTGPVTRWLYDQLTGIQLGEVEDRHGWNRIVDVGLGEERAAGASN